MAERYLIVGMGSIGKRHLECLRDVLPDAEITVWRQYHRDPTVPTGADHVVFDLESALATGPTGAIVANPAVLHLETALSLAEASIHLLVEKPISVTCDGVQRLIDLSRRKSLVLMVGYALRYSESLIFFRQLLSEGFVGRVVSFRAEVGQYLPDWRPGSDYRTGVSARKELGGGALLELSHELDYVSWVFGVVEAVSARLANTGLLEIDVEDLVEAILEVKAQDGSRITGSIHLDMLQRPPSRSCRAIGESGILEWDAIRNEVRCLDSDTGQWRMLFQAGDQERNAIFNSQLRNFSDSIHARAVPAASGADGLAVMNIVEAMRKSSEFNQRVVLT